MIIRPSVSPWVWTDGRSRRIPKNKNKLANESQREYKKEARLWFWQRGNQMMKIGLIILVLVVGAVVGVIIGALMLELYIRRQTRAKLRQLFGPEYKRERRATEALAPRGRSLRILIVEDHADTLRVLGRLLNHFGHDISMADGAQSALQIVELKEFDVVLSDIGLPDGSGYEVIAQAKRKQPVKGIALTGLCKDEDIRRSREAGFDFHLVKPVDFHELRTILTQVGS